MPSLRSLFPGFRPYAEKFFLFARRIYPGLVITSARRSFADQARLYQLYLQGKSHGLPALPPGHSMHEFGLAFDMARPQVDPLQDPALKELGVLWLKLGGKWGARDPVHFEV